MEQPLPAEDDAPKKLVHATLSGGFWLLPLGLLFRADELLPLLMGLIALAGIAAMAFYGLHLHKPVGFASERSTFEVGRAISNSMTLSLVFFLTLDAGSAIQRLVAATLAGLFALGAWLGPLSSSSLATRKPLLQLLANHFCPFIVPNGWAAASELVRRCTRRLHRRALAAAAIVTAVGASSERPFTLAIIALAWAIAFPLLLGHRTYEQARSAGAL